MVACSLLRYAPALGLLVALPGCERVGETAPAADKQAIPAGTYVVDPQTGEIRARVHRDDGSVATMRSGEDVPLDLPTGFTLYPDATVVSNTVVERGGGQGVILVMESEATPEEMAEFYRRQAEDAGIDVEIEMDAGGNEMIAGTGPDDRYFSFSADDAGDVSTAQLTIGGGFE